MIKEILIRVAPEKTNDLNVIKKMASDQLNIKENSIDHIEILKRSIDARKKSIVYQIKLAVYIEEAFVPRSIEFNCLPMDKSKIVHVIGAGPAGLFAALSAIEFGLKPIIFERGKMVRDRRRDLAAINKLMKVDSESNYCFGEGGAGTYSDGKLYTRSKKRGNVKKVLEWLVYFGADKDILVDAHPHIGTNMLPKIIESIREFIIEKGGEVNFTSKLTDLNVENGEIKSITINADKNIDCKNLILATGHSARDIYYLLNDNGIKIESKPFALGVRIEHKQELIDKIQYHGRKSDEFLPPASYSLVAQVEETGVFSFCMCPGGIVAPCATEQNEVVTNGWSPSKRNNPHANSGIVVQISPEMLKEYNFKEPFISLDFQKMVEKKCWESAGGTQKVPAQRLIDFIENKESKDLPESSYIPGLVSVNLNDVLPDLIAKRLRKAFVNFGNKMNGFMTNEAVLHAPESRTSSPVKIPRDKLTLEHVEVKGLYPCAEGAGYAGGIVSAAVDGIRCVENINLKLNSD